MLMEYSLTKNDRGHILHSFGLPWCTLVCVTTLEHAWLEKETKKNEKTTKYNQ